MIRGNKQTVGYELFLSRIIATIQQKVKKESQLSETETRAIIAQEFKAAVRTVAELTDNLTVEVPISVYPESRQYQIKPPRGYILNRVVPPLLTDQYELPEQSTLNHDVLTLPCCPSMQVTNAYYANVSVIPMMSCGDCEFDTLFVETHYDMIYAKILANLTLQSARQWRALGMHDRLEKEVQNQLRAWKSREFSRNPIKLKQERLTDGIYTTPTCAKGSFRA